MPSPAKIAFDENLKDVVRFCEIHADAVGEGPGRKHDVEVLNRAVIVFICACWEAYVEDLLRSSLDSLLTHGGASAAAMTRLRRPLEHALGSFHTPNTRGVVNLVEGVIDLPKLNKQWRWGGKPRKAGGKKLSRSDELDALVHLRGRIAHRVGAAQPIHKKHGTQAITLVTNLVATTEAAVEKHLTGIMGQPPW